MVRGQTLLLCCAVLVGLIAGYAMWGPRSSPRYVPGDCLLELGDDYTWQVKKLGRENYYLGPTYSSMNHTQEPFDSVDDDERYKKVPCPVR